MRGRGNTDRQWEYGFLLCGGAAGALYGAVSDAIVANIAPDYFELGTRIAADARPTLTAVTAGAQVGFLAGVVASAVCHYALRRTPPRQRCRTILRLIWIPFLAAGVSAVFMPLVFGMINPLGFTGHLFPGLPAEKMAPFLIVCWTRIGSYLGAAVGLTIAVVAAGRRLRECAYDRQEPGVVQGGEDSLRRRLFQWIGIAIIATAVAMLVYNRWRLGPGRFAYPDLGLTADSPLLSEQIPRPGVDLVTTTPDDFPEFLGAGRRAAVEDITLDPDWRTHPPRELWRQPIGAGWSAFSIVNGFAVTMEQRGDEEQTTCYALSSGLHHWTVARKDRFTVMGTGPRSTPTISRGRVYALGAWGHLVCIEGNSGRVVWERELLSDLGVRWEDEKREVGYGRSASPLVTDTLVIVPGGGLRGARASLLAYDAATGAPRWRGGGKQISYSSPVRAEMLGERQVLIVNEDTVAGHAIETGAELWSYPWPSNSNTDANVAQPVPLSSSRILVSKGYGCGAAVIELFRRDTDRTIEVRKVWSNRSVLRTKFTNVVIWNGHAYGLSNGVLECVDLTDGKRKWKEGRYRHGQILRVKDLLLVLGEKGELVLVGLDPRKPNNVLGRVQALTGTTWNNIALYGRFLLVRNATEAVCYELREKETPASTSKSFLLIAPEVLGRIL